MSMSMSEAVKIIAAHVNDDGKSIALASESSRLAALIRRSWVANKLYPKDLSEALWATQALAEQINLSAELKSDAVVPRGGGPNG